MNILLIFHWKYHRSIKLRQKSSTFYVGVRTNSKLIKIILFSFGFVSRSVFRVLRFSRIAQLLLLLTAAALCLFFTLSKSSAPSSALSQASFCLTLPHSNTERERVRSLKIGQFYRISKQNLKNGRYRVEKRAWWCLRWSVSGLFFEKLVNPFHF